MTENKRFELAYKKDGWWAVRDGEITLWKEEVIHLLNELNEENEELKECNVENSFMIDCFADEEVRLITENEELKKENQQLKEQILRWEHIACAGIHCNNILRQRSEKND